MIAPGALCSYVVAAGCLLAFATAGAGDRTGPGSLPAGTVELLAASPPGAPSLDPGGRYLLLAQRHSLLERRQLFAPSVSISGRRIDPSVHGPHAPLNYHGISVITLASGERREVSLPRGAVNGFPVWAPDGSRFMFTLTTDRGIELWIGDPETAHTRRLVDGLNAVFGQPCVWMPDSRHVLCQRITDGADVLSGITADQGVDWGLDMPMAAGSYRFSTSGGAIEQLLESRLQRIEVSSGRRHDIGRSAAIQSVEPAPGRDFLIVTRVSKPYPRPGDNVRINTFREIWDRSGRVVRTLPASHRAVQWQAGEPATLVWVERDQGLDRVMLQRPSFTGPSEQLFATEHRFAGLHWLENTDLALLSEYLPGRRLTRRWLIDTGPGSAAPKRFDSHHIDAGNGLPMMTRNHRGRNVVAVRAGRFFLGGLVPSGNGDAAPYIDEVDLETLARRRLWTDDNGGHERVVAMLPGRPQEVLTRYETADTPPNYYLVDVAGDGRLQLTHDTHAGPALGRVEQIPLRYTRDDGLPLSATLHVPPRDESRAPLPLVIWAYPKEVDGRAVSPDAPSTQRYAGPARAMKLFFVLAGYAVMDGVSMPVAGDERNANDDFVNQIVANARAAVDAAASTGLVDPARVAIAGHSYGAFMAANLLAHSRLFRAGAALSGAYNRTLTPFGFQTERRTLWEATETYLAMSPLLHSDRIDAPLLLVHGTADNNTGTSPFQSLQFYRAIRGNGGDAELLLLPREGHTYRARESVIETASAMLDWFDRHLKPCPARRKPIDNDVAVTE